MTLHARLAMVRGMNHGLRFVSGTALCFLLALQWVDATPNPATTARGPAGQVDRDAGSGDSKNRSNAFIEVFPLGNPAPVPCPMSLQVDFSKRQGLARNGRSLWLIEPNRKEAKPSAAIPGQFEAETTNSARGWLRWLQPPGDGRPRQFTLVESPTTGEPPMLARQETSTGRWNISEEGKPVLCYNYQTNAPGELLAKISPGNVKYARPRGDYIHPLFGLDGEEWTKDWSLDHPHQRGIYWAWPEVDYRGERGDLHALQRVFARPTGHCTGESGPVFAQIEAENLWLWEDREPIVRERTTIRAWRGDATGRFIDLECQFTAMADDVAIARRETKLYGGLNIRLAPVKDQQITSDPIGANPRAAWAQLSGTFAGGFHPAGLVVLQDPRNPDYPGDWVKYPEINWFQPAFPTAGTRYALKKNVPLRLNFRLWVRAGRGEASELAAVWAAYANPPRAVLTE